MKKQIVLIVALVLSLSATAIAHPGRTDSEGGHHVGGTSEYHYHHGYEAHQHTGGICPYDFDDKTGEDSGSSSSGSSPSSSAVSIPSSPEEEESALDIFWRVINLILITPSMLFFGFLFFVIPVLVPIQNAIGKRKAEKQEREFVKRNYLGKTRNEIAALCGMPDELCVDKNDLPHDRGVDSSLDRCTVYLQYHSSIYHSNTACTRGMIRAINITETRFCVPCPKCSPAKVDLSWYKSYEEALRLMRKHGIEPLP